MTQAIAACPLQQVHVDPAATLASAAASIAAYSDFQREKFENPEGFEFVDRFTGCVKLLMETGQEESSGLYAYPEERFGLIFRSTVEPGTYLVAFRGTDSILDMVKDLYIKTVPFKPYDAPDFPHDVLVATGFNGIYADAGGGMASSMQQQLFTKLAKLDPAPKTVVATGHSLGGALASLFALDVAASRGDLKAASTTFASPRVGDETWQSTYDKTFGLQSATYRIVNYYDWVPALPPEWLSVEPPQGIFNYRHVGQQFLAAFKVKNARLPYVKSKHSMANYQTVLSHAVRLPDPQVWVGELKDAVSGYPMVSECPPSTKVPLWANDLPQEKRFAAAARLFEPT